VTLWTEPVGLSVRVGVFLGGVKETNSEGQPYCVEGVAFDEIVMQSIQQQP
jgi:hypothetical protein